MMKKILRIIIFTLATVAPQWAHATDRPAFVPTPQPVLNTGRLIVKYKTSTLPPGLSAAQALVELRKPLAQNTLNQLQAAAGTALGESHALSDGAHVIILHDTSSKQAISQAIANIRKLPEIEYVEEDIILTPQYVPNDPYFTPALPAMWSMKPATTVASPAPGGTGNYGADFQTAWDTVTGTGIVVAVVDTGITAHADIVGSAGTVSPATGNLISDGYDFITDCRIRGSCANTTSNASAIVTPSANASDTGDFLSSADCTTTGSVFYGCSTSNSSWHGTHVAGTIAALGNNSVGVVGGAFTAKILPVRVLGKGGGSLSDIAEGVRWAAGVHSTPNPNAAKVINMSLGGTSACSATMQAAIDAAYAAGATIIVAAGNSNTDVSTATPANCNHVISVASIGRDGSRAIYSNYSSPASNTSNPVQITLAAQGGDKSLGSFDPGIQSTLNSGTSTPVGDTYAYYQGTSMATPHVAAAATLMLSRNNMLAPAQIKTILTSSVTTFPSFSSAGWAAYDCATKKNCGTGILNAKLAVQNSLTPLTPSVAELDFGTITINGGVVTPKTMTLTLTNNSVSAVTLSAAQVTGAHASAFSVNNDTCSSNTIIAITGTCQLTVSFLPTAEITHTAGLFIPVNPATGGSVAVGLTGKASFSLTAATALAATRSDHTNSTGGGCSIMPTGSSPDFSLLLTLLAIIAYRLFKRSHARFGKN